MNILPCTAEDLDPLLHLVDDFLHEQIRYEIAFTPAPGWQNGCHEFMEKVLSSDNYFIDLMKHENEIAGFHMYGMNQEKLFVTSKQGYIADLYVKKEFRRQQVGRLLVEHGLKRLKDMGAYYVQLNVLIQNPKGVAFWKALGFQDQIARMKLDLCDIPQTLAEAKERGHTPDTKI